MFTSHCSPWSWRAVHVGVALFGSANGDSNAAPIPGPSRHFLLVHFYHQASKWRRIDILVRKPLRPAIVRVNSRRPPFVESVFIFKGNISFFFRKHPLEGVIYMNETQVVPWFYPPEFNFIRRGTRPRIKSTNLMPGERDQIG